MPIEHISQPELIQVNTNIRLRKYDGICDFALEWYKDEQTLLLVNGDERPYDLDRLYKMYNYQNSHGELYFIEYKNNDIYEAIGDVSLSQNDMAIVIGDAKYRKKHIGYLVIKKLIERAKELKFDTIYVDEIYDFNIASQKCFESLGFASYEKTTRGHKYSLKLDTINQRVHT